MKPQPFYRSPFDRPGIFSPVSRKEAAQLVWQWRRHGESIDHMTQRDGRARGYLFRGRDGESAAMVLKGHDAR